MNEDFFRFSAFAIFLIGAGISAYHRHKADRETGQKISPKSEGLPIMITLHIFGLSLWLGVKEAALLIEKFGDEYRKNMKKTGLYLPRIIFSFREWD